MRRLNQVCRAKESTVVKGLTLAGTTWPGVVAWDDMRTVDYLRTRPEVDPKRVGCVGISMGGYRAAYLTALHDGIAVGCVVGFMSSVRPMMQAHLDTHSFVHFLPGLHTALDFPDVAALAAPRAFLLIGGDSADGARSWPYVEAVAPVWSPCCWRRPSSPTSSSSSPPAPPSCCCPCSRSSSSPSVLERARVLRSG